jgi:hypothetical protein
VLVFRNIQQTGRYHREDYDPIGTLTVVQFPEYLLKKKRKTREIFLVMVLMPAQAKAEV